MVETLQEIADEPKGGIGGAIAGGLVGGLVANQIDKGSGRRIATVLGAAGSETPPVWQSGDRVRLQNGLLTMGGGRPNGNPGTI